MPYSTKRKSIGEEEPLSCPFGQGGVGEKTRSKAFPCLGTGLGQSWDLLHICHWRDCAFLALLHCPSAQCKHSAQGYSRRQNYFLLKSPFVSQLARSFRLQRHCALDKESGEEKIKKKEKSLMNFLFKKNFQVPKIQGDLCLWHSLAPSFFL